jgi:hypothetical protein
MQIRLQIGLEDHLRTRAGYNRIMKKYMVADLVKDLKEDQIKYLLDNYNITISDAKYIVDNYRDQYAQDLIAKAMDVYGLNMRDAEEFVGNYPNESTWADVEETAESLGVDITDVDDDDVENYMEMGGMNKGELNSSVGLIQWIYDNKLKAYIVYMSLQGLKCGTGEVMYKLTPEQMKDWNSQDSMGEYYNNNVRSQIEEDPAVSCGCCENLCEPQQIDTFKQRYSSIS